MKTEQYIEQQIIRHVMFIESFRKISNAFGVTYQRKDKRFTVSGMHMEIANDRCRRAKRIEMYIAAKKYLAE